MRKLDARDRAQIVALAYQTGLAEPGGTVLPSPVAAPAVDPVVRLCARRELARDRLGALVPARRPGEVTA